MRICTLACRSGLWLAGISVLIVGCSTGAPHGWRTSLPKIRQSRFANRMRSIPEGAAPIYAWHGSRTGLKTYWGDQDLSVHVAAHLPSDWKQPGDGCWEVTAKNAEGKHIPFLGLVHTYLNENGNEMAVLVPPIDLQEVPDGLYTVIIPNVEARDGEIASVRPTALLFEVRHHSFKPFRVKIPLMPEQESALTPKPEEIPEVPAGTPIPID